MNEGFNEFENHENIDAEVEAESAKLESSLESLQHDIESLGGGEALQAKLDTNEALRDSVDHKAERLSWALKGALVFAPAGILGTLGEVNALAHPEYFPHGQYDNISKGLGAMALIGLVTTAVSVVEFIKHHRALKAEQA